MKAVDFVMGKVNAGRFNFSEAVVVKEYSQNMIIGKNDAVLIKGKDWRKAVDKVYGKGESEIRIIVLGGDDELNRKILENKKVNALLSPEIGRVKQKLKKQDSGLNNVLCNIARENGIAIIENLQDIINAGDKANLLAKIMQNIRLCKKYKTKMKIASFARNDEEMRDAYDIKSLGMVLGMDTEMASRAMELRL